MACPCTGKCRQKVAAWELAGRGHTSSAESRNWWWHYNWANSSACLRSTTPGMFPPGAFHHSLSGSVVVTAVHQAKVPAPLPPSQPVSLPPLPTPLHTTACHHHHHHHGSSPNCMKPATQSPEENNFPVWDIPHNGASTV